MDQRRRASYVFQGPVQQFQAGDSYGDNTYHQHNYTSGEVIKALTLPSKRL